ncbi:MAG: PspC domain-containing protein [Mycobacteriaceae bacterium]
MSTTTAPATLQRRTGARVIGGVAGGVADHLGVDAQRVRIAFVVLAGVGGAGVLAYGALWLLTPSAEDTGVLAPGERSRALGLALLGVGLSVSITLLVDGSLAAALIPVVVVAVGAAVVWRAADGEAARPRVLTTARVLGGATLVVVGLSVVVIAQVDLGAVRTGLLAVLATLVGVALLTVPLWLRLYHAFEQERHGRIRNEERAEIASHLHDSVLQTLALIQKQSEHPQDVARLARRQERELRAWLFDHDGAPTATLAGGLKAVAAEVEDAHGVLVRPVVVGDCALDPAANAILEATREAVRNAAAHSGAEQVDVFAEVEPTQVSVFVRDRGRGFDPEEVPVDRHGLAGSVHERMHRHGGTAQVRSAPGEGTEVRLSVPRGSGNG